MERDWPLTATDLRVIADRVEEIVIALTPASDYLDDGDWRWGVTVTVWNPEGEDDDVAGVVAPHGDGYLGFYPRAIKRARPAGEQ